MSVRSNVFDQQHSYQHFGRLFTLKYANGRDILPAHLLKEIQQYVSGEIVYIPREEETRRPWGELSGFRKQLKARNISIVESYRNGASIEALTDEFCLSESSIRKIVYAKN